MSPTLRLVLRLHSKGYLHLADRWAFLAVVEPDQLELYVLNAGEQSPSVPVSGVSRLVFAADGLHYAASTQQNQILLGTLGPSEPQVLTGHKDGITSLAFSPDSTQLASSGFDKSLIIWDVGSAKNRILLH